MQILSYTREPLADEIYAARLAAAMHLAIRDEKTGKFLPLHHNEGILYARAVSRPDGTLTAKSLKNPAIFRKPDGSFVILAVRTETEGEKDPESEGCVLCFTSPDLVHYREEGLILLRESGFIDAAEITSFLEAADCQNPEAAPARAEIRIRMEDGSAENVTVPVFNGRLPVTFASGMTGALRAEGASPAGISRPCTWNEETAVPAEACADLAGYRPESARITEISDEQGDYLRKKLTVPVCVRMDTQAGDRPVSAAELSSVRAVAAYSDGTRVLRRVDWNLPESTAEPASGAKNNPEEKTAGALASVDSAGRIKGRVHQEHFDFPMAPDRADPCCMLWRGKYYFIATSEHDNNRSLYVRCAESLQDLPDAPQKLILDTAMYSGIGNLLWAPEFHEINGDLYIFHAATSGEFYHEECRVMKLAPGGDPANAADWSAPQMVVRRDGSPLCEEGKVISLDMTEFLWDNRYYVIWSQRQFLPVDQGAWLMIAEIDPNEPWHLLTDPVCICKPVYGWENNHTFVTEGPYPLVYGGRLMVTYSGALVDSTYTVGMLKLKERADLLSPESWEKSNYALMSSASCEGEYGPGHNSYLLDKNGLVWNFYHARPGVKGPRSAGIRRVHFDIDGEPMLDVTEDRDLPEKFRTVCVTLR